MSTQTTTTCDIRECGKEAVHKQKTISVRFTTDQTEGRQVPHYLSGEKLDLCAHHYDEYVSHLPLIGWGAQGHNEYVFDIK